MPLTFPPTEADNRSIVVSFVEMIAGTSGVEVPGAVQHPSKIPQKFTINFSKIVYNYHNKFYGQIG